MGRVREGLCSLPLGRVREGLCPLPLGRVREGLCSLPLGRVREGLCSLPLGRARVGHHLNSYKSFGYIVFFAYLCKVNVRITGFLYYLEAIL